MSSSNDILRRKMRPRPIAVGAAVAWWNANVDLMLRELFKLEFEIDVEITIPEERKDNSRSALRSMEKVMLPFLLKGAGGHRGLFVLDGLLIDSLIELQMLDKVLPTPRLDRPITTIDAGLSEGFVHKCLNAMSDAPGVMADLSVMQAQQDRAALRLALNDTQFDIMSVQINMGPGIKTGMFELWLPISEVTKPPPSKNNPKMMKLLAECEAELDARMIGCKVAASELVALAPGALIRLPANALTDVTVSDCEARRIASGRLGQLNGMRAVLITDMEGKQDAAAAPKAPPPPDLPAPMAPAADPLVGSDLPMPETSLPEFDTAPDLDNFDPGIATAL